MVKYASVKTDYAHPWTTKYIVYRVATACVLATSNNNILCRLFVFAGNTSTKRDHVIPYKTFSGTICSRLRRRLSISVNTVMILRIGTDNNYLRHAFRMRLLRYMSLQWQLQNAKCDSSECGRTLQIRVICALACTDKMQIRRRKSK
jgi:hypothetical protein